MVTRQDIYTEALKWLHTPWHHRQCLNGVGVDCVRLFEGVAKALGLLEPSWEPPMYSQSFHLHSDRELVQEVLLELGAMPELLDARQPGDLLLFKFGRSCAHVAMQLPQNEILHAVKASGRVVQNSLAGDWLTRLRCAYRFPGVAVLAASLLWWHQTAGGRYLP